MSELIGIIFFFFGIVCVIAGKDIIEALACFLIYAILSGVWELKQIREELEDWEE